MKLNSTKVTLFDEATAQKYISRNLSMNSSWIFNLECQYLLSWEKFHWSIVNLDVQYSIINSKPLDYAKIHSYCVEVFDVNRNAFCLPFEAYCSIEYCKDFCINLAKSLNGRFAHIIAQFRIIYLEKLVTFSAQRLLFIKPLIDWQAS